MTEQLQVTAVSHPPGALLRVENVVWRFLLRTPVAGPLRKMLMILYFNGRKTGRRYVIPVSAHRIDNDLYALTAMRWKYNFRGGANAEVLHNGKSMIMRGELIDDRAVAADLYRRAAESYSVRRAQFTLGLKFRERRIPTVEEFADAVDHLGLAAIRLTPTE